MELLKIRPKKTVAKKKKKPRRAKQSVTFSDAENKLLKRVCKKDDITPNRLIKSVVREYLKERSAKINEEIAENQLSLFKNPTPVQFRIDGKLHF